IGMLALFEATRVVYAAPDDALYVVDTIAGQTSGTCRRGVITPTVAYDYTTACTLEFALEIAQDGDELYLEAGLYETAVTISKSLTLIGGFPDGFATGGADPVANPTANPTVIRPSTAVPAITIEGPVTTTATTSVVLNGLFL